jgi:putative FmdB family regulatory protein
MVIYDFRCGACRELFEDLVPMGAEDALCPSCGGTGTREYAKSAHICTVIVPDYPGSKAQKAGYAHTTHAPQNATKVQSGYGGCQSPHL